MEGRGGRAACPHAGRRLDGRPATAALRQCRRGEPRRDINGGPVVRRGGCPGRVRRSPLHHAAAQGTVQTSPRASETPSRSGSTTLGCSGCADEKFVPDGIFHVSKARSPCSSAHLGDRWSVTVSKSGRGGRVYYASTSRRLVDDLSRLLLRFGISTRVRTTHKAGYRDGYTLDISGRTASGGSSRRSASTDLEEPRPTAARDRPRHHGQNQRRHGARRHLGHRPRRS